MAAILFRGGGGGGGGGGVNYIPILPQGYSSGVTGIYKEQ